MRSAGIAVTVKTRRRPTTYLVIIDDSSGLPVIVKSEIFPSDATDNATQLHDTAEAVRSCLSGEAIDTAIVRRADRPPRPNSKGGPKHRLLMEGAVASAARSVVVKTLIGTGADTGAWFGSDKNGVDLAAAQLLAEQGMPSKFAEATSAALAALRMPWA